MDSSVVFHVGVFCENLIGADKLWFRGQNKMGLMGVTFH